MKKNLFKGISFTVGASLWWGIIGVIYFKFVSYASPLELAIHRTIWTALLLVITTSYYNKWNCLLYTSPSPRDYAASRMPSSA